MPGTFYLVFLVSTYVTIFILFKLWLYTIIGIFTIVPETQYVYLNHNVTFECATNLTGYTLTFSYGGAVDATVKQTNLLDGGIKSKLPSL